MNFNSYSKILKGSEVIIHENEEWTEKDFEKIAESVDLSEELCSE